jgi:hypothetical protein
MTGRLEGGSPGATTHWSAAAMAKVQGIRVKFGAKHLARAWFAAAPDASVRAVQRPAVRHQATRHRRSLYGSSGHAVVLSIDEKGQIQALDRAQPGLPLQNGR